MHFIRHLLTTSGSFSIKEGRGKDGYALGSGAGREEGEVGGKGKRKGKEGQRKEWKRKIGILDSSGVIHQDKSFRSSLCVCRRRPIDIK